MSRGIEPPPVRPVRLSSGQRSHMGPSSRDASHALGEASAPSTPPSSPTTGYGTTPRATCGASGGGMVVAIVRRARRTERRHRLRSRWFRRPQSRGRIYCVRMQEHRLTASPSAPPSPPTAGCGTTPRTTCGASGAEWSWRSSGGRGGGGGTSAPRVVGVASQVERARRRVRPRPAAGPPRVRRAARAVAGWSRRSVGGRGGGGSAAATVAVGAASDGRSRRPPRRRHP